MADIESKFTVNGADCSVSVEARTSLADCLRHELKLTGTHLGCEHGVCGACTIIVNGEAVRSCLMLAAQADGCDIVTVEGLSSGDDLGPLQMAFRRHHALQCGFCTPGILMSFTDYLRRNPKPTEQEVVDVLSGHICRCTGYAGIVAAVLEATGTAAPKTGGKS